MVEMVVLVTLEVVVELTVVLLTVAVLDALVVVELTVVLLTLVVVEDAVVVVERVVDVRVVVMQLISVHSLQLLSTLYPGSHCSHAVQSALAVPPFQQPSLQWFSTKTSYPPVTLIRIGLLHCTTALMLGICSVYALSLLPSSSFLSQRMSSSFS